MEYVSASIRTAQEEGLKTEPATGQMLRVEIGLEPAELVRLDDLRRMLSFVAVVVGAQALTPPSETGQVYAFYGWVAETFRSDAERDRFVRERGALVFDIVQDAYSRLPGA